MSEFLAFMGAIVRAYCEQHEPDALDRSKDIAEEIHSGGVTRIENWTANQLSYLFDGWWVIDDTAGWKWWVGIYTRCPAGEDIWQFPHCKLDAPLPNADFSEFGLESRHTLAEAVATG